MKLLVTGASGLLGQKVALLALENGYEVYSIYKEHPTFLGNPIKLDLADKSKVSETIFKLRPQAIVHTAAHEGEHLKQWIEGKRFREDKAEKRAYKILMKYRLRGEA